ncbi:AraC family transcriptional regulator [Actinomadura parmotrematis]|uniref:AraC family transcriptional regulator n=1 Tax=Actinomadura parmotrematis TaxID=2864039 RepID=A0ABS7FVX6_9ACTN|nr:AraC family transcriptional regulator [Actinomadura parmotrematis]MBW8484578.1 AraC family transcriptional regulator [Actinomadura parmotrematis]
MTERPGRDTVLATAPDAALDEALDAALHRLRLNGAIFFRAEFTEAWSYLSPHPERLVEALHPGARSIILFHIVVDGPCWVSLEGGERLWAESGDVVVLPYADQHTMGGTADAEPVPITDLMDPRPWTALPMVRHGGGGAAAGIVCGYLHSSDPLFDPGLAALPPVFVVRPPEGPAAQWIQASVQYAVAATTSAEAPTDATSVRLPELLLVEVLRLHLRSAPTIGSGWIAALADPVLAPALAALHADPARRWTVAALAETVAVSRSSLDERFRQVLGRSPIRYLTDWRLHLADDLLATTDRPVAVIARRVGYESEEAFGRAFKRRYGASPGAWRRTRTP